MSSEYLSEADLIAQHPSLQAAMGILMLAGLLALVYLLVGCWNRRRSAEGRAFLHVGPKPWALREVLLVAGILLVGMSLIAGALQWAPLDDDHLMVALLLGELGLRVLILAGFLWYLSPRCASLAQAFDLSSVDLGRGLRGGALFYLAALPALALVSVLYTIASRWLPWQYSMQPVAEMFVHTRSTLLVISLTVFAVVLAPILEELFFRGFAYPALKQRWGAAPALAIVALVFALVHGHGPSFAPLFTLALGLGLAYELTGSLFAPMVMHALFNLTNVGLLLYERMHP